MESLEDEGEIILGTVSEYEFEDAAGHSISFGKLPLEWNKVDIGDEMSSKIFLRGKIDNGLQSILKPVIAWKFDISRRKLKPQISVLSENGHWIKLLKPRSRFQPIIRTIQISLCFLHFCKWNPQGSQRGLWEHLKTVFRVFERRPSEDDFRPHLIKEAVQRDQTLKNSKIITTFLDGKPRKRKVVNEDVGSTFIVDDVDEDRKKSAKRYKPEVSDEEEEDDDEAEVDEDEWDFVCALCDNGGFYWSVTASV